MIFLKAQLLFLPNNRRFFFLYKSHERIQKDPGKEWGGGGDLNLPLRSNPVYAHVEGHGEGFFLGTLFGKIMVFNEFLVQFLAKYFDGSSLGNIGESLYTLYSNCWY